MVDISTVVTDVEGGIDVAEPVVNAVLPALSIIPGLGWISVVWSAIQAIRGKTGKGLPAAAAEFVSHNTPGMPNSPALSGE